MKTIYIDSDFSYNTTDDNTQTVSVSGVTASNTIIVTPDPASFSAYTESGILCTSQASGTLTFVCEDDPAETITVNVAILS